MKNNNSLSFISLFSGAMGLDLGIEKAGFIPKLAVDIDKYCCDTIKINKPNLPVIQADIHKLSAEDILSASGFKKGELCLLAGGSPCQSFSTAGKRRTLNDERGQLILKFIDLVEQIQPQYFILENVRGILSATAINDNNEEYKVLDLILKRFDEIGYNVNYSLFNSADYGVPQTRERIFFLGSRDGTLIELPEPTHSKANVDNKQPWINFNKVIENLKDTTHTYIDYGEKRLKYMKMIPSGGGNWRDLPDNTAKEAMGKAYYSGGGKVGFFRRIDINKPSPTLLTSPVHKSTNLGHPLEDRPLSIEEYKAIQQFPLDWKISGTINQQYKQIGNAVPVGLGYAVASSVKKYV